jgi:hypothetical protein
VLLCGYLAAFAGILIILCMSLPWFLKIVLATAFIGESIRESRRLTRGAARLRQLRLDAEGSLTALGPDGRVEPLLLLSGSIVLARLAWLRVRFADGSEHGELLRGDPATDPEWQRLQLIWRHRRTPIGSQDGS